LVNHTTLTTRFEKWIAPFCQAFRHKAQSKWAPVYVRGLLHPGERKSVEPMAARVAPGEDDQLHHFVATSTWDTSPLEDVLLEKANTLVGGDDSHLIIDDTSFPKKGDHSVGVAPQYCGALGKRANCQSMVSVTLARGDVPVVVALRLYLPESWTSDRDRCAKAKVPEDIEFRTKIQIALAEIRRIREAGVRFGDVLADAGYGMSIDFRAALTDMGLLWAVGISPDQLVYPADVAIVPPARRKPGTRGPPLKWGTPNKPRQTVSALFERLGRKAFARVSWRQGTKGTLSMRMAAVRVRPADGTNVGDHHRLPTDEVWLVCEHRSSTERKYYFSNYPPDLSLKALAGVIKARWSCEQAHQQLKEELGLDHFEGRSWHGLHHHALMAQIAFAFLQHIRVTEKKA
jgi:SRSO17 transposase